MATPVIVQSFTAASQQNTGTSATYTVAPSPATQPQIGDIVICLPWGWQTSGYGVTSVTDSQGSFASVIASDSDAGATSHIYWRQLTATPAADTYSVTVDHSQASGNYAKAVIIIARATGGSGWQVEGTAVKSLTSPAATGVTLSGLTTSAADALVVSVMALNSSNNPAGIGNPPSTYTTGGVEQDGVNSMPGIGVYKIVTASGAQSITYSWTSSFTGTQALAAFSNPGGGSYTITANQGSYSLTGQTSNLLYARIMSANQGSYTLTGQVVGLTYGNTARSILADPGSYTVIGSDALVDLALVFAQGTYNLTGQNVALIYTPLNNFSLTCDQGSYSLNGQAASVLFNAKLGIEFGQYSLNGRSVQLVWSGAPAGGNYFYQHLTISSLKIGI